MQQEERSTTPRPCIDAACAHAETRIREAGRLLLDIRPEAVERCRSELQDVAAELAGLVSEGAFQTNPRVLSALSGIKRSAQTLKLQVECASNLYFGWVQLRLGAGYTQQGLPVLTAAESRSSFEA